MSNTTRADRLSVEAKLLPCLDLGICKGHVPNLRVIIGKLAQPSFIFEHACYAYDQERPTDKTQRIRVHQFGGLLGYFVLTIDDSRKPAYKFLPVSEDKIRIVVRTFLPSGQAAHEIFMFNEYQEIHALRKS